MSRQDPRAGTHMKLFATRFCVATQDIHVVTQLRLLHQNSVATKSKKEQVATSNYVLQQKPAIRTETLLRRDFQVTTEKATWARIFWIHKVASILGPKLLGLYK